MNNKLNDKKTKRRENYFLIKNYKETTPTPSPHPANERKKSDEIDDNNDYNDARKKKKE